MTKKHFIALADSLRKTMPTGVLRPELITNDGASMIAGQWIMDRDTIADFCQSQNPGFNRERWIAYINGDCGPNGGTVKK